MASKTKNGSTPGEIAAAHAEIDRMAQVLGKHNDSIKFHVQTVEAERDELKEQLASEKSAREKETTELRHKLETLKNQAQAAVKERDDRLKRALNIVSGSPSTDIG